MIKKRVLVAMSGGVDSSVAAYLLIKAGYDVIGATISFWKDDGRCCSIEDTRKIAQKLSIPFYTFNFKEEFEREIINYFCDEYANGRTPNPCIICNEKIKFGVFLEKAKKLNASFIATGHYARVDYNFDVKRYQLKKGQDKEKDQSYFLFSLSQYQLSHTIFPLSSLTKKKVRKIAKELGLPIYKKDESQEICFISRSNYNEFLREKRPDSFNPGPILTTNGKVIGQHRGIPFFTIGQRKGLGGGRKNPVYVLKIDKKKNAIVVGEKEKTYARGMQVSKVNWVSIPEPTAPILCKVKIRSQHQEASATVYPLNNKKCKVIFSQPQWAITPGQAAVFYREDTVLGGGWIEEVA